MRDTGLERRRPAGTERRLTLHDIVAVHLDAVRSMSYVQKRRMVLLPAVFPYMTRVFAPVPVEGTVAGFMLAALFVLIVVRGRVHMKTCESSPTTNHGYRRETYPVRLVDE